MKYLFAIAALLALAASPEVAAVQEPPLLCKNHFILESPCFPQEPPASSWSPARDMSEPRSSHSATLLADGRVLVAGGAAVKSAEIYDPVLGTWTLTGEMVEVRRGHTAVRLPNGKVFFAGGAGPGNASAELFDPATGTWTRAAEMLVPRTDHALTLLADGTVMASGGVDFSGVASGWWVDDLPSRMVEIYDPESDSWRYAGSLETPRYWHTATLVPDGRVLVAGGATKIEFHGYTALAELYDPGSDTWVRAGAFALARSRATATSLVDGSVLIVGGYNAFGYGACGWVCSHVENDRFDPLKGWRTAPKLNAPRNEHTTTRLANGQLLVTGGEDWAPVPRAPAAILASTELYDDARGSWIVGDNLSIARSSHTATLLEDGRVLVIGGYTGVRSGYTGVWTRKPLASAEIFTPRR